MTEQEKRFVYDFWRRVWATYTAVGRVGLCYSIKQVFQEEGLDSVEASQHSYHSQVMKEAFSKATGLHDAGYYWEYTREGKKARRDFCLWMAGPKPKGAVEFEGEME